MPSYNAKAFKLYNRKRPWRARVMVRGMHYFCGYYATREEALIAEDEFRGGYEGKRNGYNVGI